MKLLMENWRDYQRENDFGILCEDFKRGSIQQDELMLIWERQVNKQLDPLLEEISLLEEGLLDMGKEAFAKLTAKAKEAWAEKVSAFYEKAKLFIVKTVNQAITITKNFLSKIPDTLKKIEINSYFTILNGIKKLMMGAARVSKYVGRFAIIALGALVVIIALSSVAHAAAAGVEPDAQIMNVASEMIMQAWEAAGAVETTQFETIFNVSQFEMVDGEVLQDVNSVVRGLNAAHEDPQNQLVDALQTTLTAAEGWIADHNTGRGTTPAEIVELFAENNADVAQIVNDYVAQATELKQTDPELFADYARLGENIDVLWDGVVNSFTEIVDISSAAADSTRAEVSTVTRGMQYPSRGQ